MGSQLTPDVSFILWTSRRFGETVSIPLFTSSWRPDSFYDRIKRNRAGGLHTLCLLGRHLPIHVPFLVTHCYKDPNP